MTETQPYSAMALADRVRAEKALAGKLMRTYAKFLRSYNGFLSAEGRLPLSPDAYIVQEGVLLEISRRYYMEEIRKQQAHPIEKMDEHKNAGYITYWIAKLRPIAVLPSEFNGNPARSININARFAIYAGINLMYANPPATVDSAFWESAEYTLNYRVTTGDNLAMMYYLEQR